MDAKNKIVALPWYFRPWLMMILFLWGGVIAPLLFYSNANSISGIIGGLSYTMYSILYFSWSTLLYIYLSPSAKESSKHKPGRYKHLYYLLLVCFALGAVLTALGFNTLKATEPADLIVLPIFYAFFRLNWRASDLLVELEGKEFSARIYWTFLAMFYHPILTAWFANRLRILKRHGKI